MQIRFDGQVALITGGSRGIGAATVKLFAQAGASVLFNYRKAARQAGQLVASCGNDGRVIAERAEVSKMRDAKRLVECAIGRFGRLDVLVANAGIWNVPAIPVQKISEHEWDEMVAVNLKGVYSLIHFAVPYMIRRKSGRIIVVSSTAGQRGEAFHTHYGAAKGGAISFVKGLSTELAPHRILVNCVAPGWVDTDMCSRVLRDRAEARAIASRIPLGRVARPEEVAMPILFLASDMASYMTGEIVNVNGGSVLCG